MEIIIENQNELLKAAKLLIDFAKEKKVFLFYGEMGAGKTTFINAICKHLGVVAHTSSPTYAIVNEYKAQTTTIYHFDFYRLKTQTEALDLGYEEYFYSGAYCFIEWPEKISDLLPQNCVKINISVIDTNKRMISLE